MNETNDWIIYGKLVVLGDKERGGLLSALNVSVQIKGHGRILCRPWPFYFPSKKAMVIHP
jgi:hypothetical protein